VFGTTWGWANDDRIKKRKINCGLILLWLLYLILKCTVTCQKKSAVIIIQYQCWKYFFLLVYCIDSSKNTLIFRLFKEHVILKVICYMWNRTPLPQSSCVLYVWVFKLSCVFACVSYRVQHRVRWLEVLLGTVCLCPRDFSRYTHTNYY